MNQLTPVPNKDRTEIVLASLCSLVLFSLGIAFFLIKDLKGVGIFLPIGSTVGYIGWIIGIRKRKPIDKVGFDNEKIIIESKIENTTQIFLLDSIEAVQIIRQKYNSNPLYCTVRTKGKDGYYGFIVGINNYTKIDLLAKMLEERAKGKIIYEERDGWTFYSGRRSLLRKYEGTIKAEP